MRRLLTLTLAAAALIASPASAAAPLDLGPGATPDVAVDAGGTAHVVLQAGAGSALPVDYCRIPRGATACDLRTRLPLGETTGRPRILVRSDGLLIVAAARHVDAAWPTYVLTSADGGATWSPPAVTGSAFADVQAIELTADGQALDLLHRSSLTGHELQRVPLAGPAEARVVRLDGTQWDTHATLAAVDGTTVYLRDTYGAGTIRQRTFAGGDLYAPAAWPERRFGGRRRELHPDTASGPRGTWLATHAYRSPRRVQLRRLRAAGPGPARAISRPAGVRALRLAQDGRGRLHVTWLAGSEQSGACPSRFRCLVGTRGTWKRVRGERRLVFPRERVLVQSRSGAAPDAGLETAAGAGGAAAAVFVTSGGSVRLVRLAR